MKNKNIIFIAVLVVILVCIAIAGSSQLRAISCEKNSKGLAQADKKYNYYSGSQGGAPAGFDTYSNPQLGLSFNKPQSWQVYIADGNIYVKPSSESPASVFLCPILRADKKMRPLHFARFVYDEAKKVYPDVTIKDKRVNQSDTIAEIAASFTKKNMPMWGFYMVSLDGGRGLFCGYEDSINSFDRNATAFREILRSLQIQPFAFYNGTSKGQAYGGGGAGSNMGPTIDVNHFVSKASDDGTMYIACPPDWPANGGNYFFIAHSPDGWTGVFTSNDHQPKTFDPQAYLMHQLMPWMKCSATTITKAEPNNDYMKMLQAQGVPSNAVNFIGETTNGAGLRLKYGIMVSASNLQAYGAPGGYVTTYGVFDHPETFDRNMNTLVAMALSITADTGKIMSILRANLDRLDAASHTISQTGDVVISMVRSSSANLDRIIDKYNYASSGEEARYSPLEDKIYVVDSNLADYASNPNYPQEMLTTVPDSKWNTVQHDRTYVP